MTLEQKIELLQDMSAELGAGLQLIQSTRAQAKIEIDGEGLTPETCEKMAKLLHRGEKLARGLDTGLLSVHQSMAKFIPEDASEGQKPWPP